jgi:hypothetical protein
MTPPRHLLPLLAALAFAPLAISPAYAGEVEKAEHTRISEEMRKLAARNAWSAVEQSYQHLTELEAKGEVISYKEFMLGAEAARALGDMGACRARVERASKLDPTKEALDWLADIDTNYGRVDISFDGKYTGERVLAPTVPPFAPDQRASITLAAAQITGGKGFNGLLPAGEYSVAGQKVTVTAGVGKVASLHVGPPAAAPKEPFKLAYVGPRAELGVAFTQAGSVASAPTDLDALQPAAFSGEGVRLGVGLEVGLTQHVGVIAEVGYHNLFGAAAPTGEPLAEHDGYPVAGNNLHMGYGWLAASFRFGNLWLAAGPLWGAGAGVATGVAGSGDDGLATSEEIPDAPEDAAAYQRLNGNVRAGGGAASLSYAMVDLGSLRGALTLEGGAQTDTYRLYPWGQVAFTIAPAASRRTK